VGVYLAIYADQSREMFEALRENQAQIEKTFGGPLEWLEKRKDAVYWIGAGSLTAVPGEEDWPRQHEWLASTMKKLHHALEPYVATLERPSLDGDAGY